MRRLELLVLVGLAACGALREPSPPAGICEPCATAADCAAPLVCFADGLCDANRNMACKIGVRRCDDGVVKVCAGDEPDPGCHDGDHGSRWDLVETCALGCREGACVQAVCAPGEHRCEGDLLLVCNESRSGWTQEALCENGCDAGGIACVL